MSLVIEFWNAPRALRTPMNAMKVHFKSLTTPKDDDGVYANCMDVPGKDSICGLHTMLAKPHIDISFPGWTALLILEANDHLMWVADHTPRNAEVLRKPLKSPLYNVTLQPGIIVLFNCHRTHWMDKAKNNSIMIAAAFDFSERPSKKEVNRHIIGATKGLK